MGDVSTDLLKRVKERQREKGLPEAEPTADTMPQFDEDVLITDEDLGTDHQPDEIDQAIDALGIVEAYNRWSGKGQVENRGSRTEGIKVRCPRPDHVDRNPSAWLNTEDDLWYCGACDVGGDALVLAAYNFGFGDNYQSDFPELKKRIGAELGFIQKKTLGGNRYYEKIGEAEPTPEPEPEEDNPQAEVEGPSAAEKLRGKISGGFVPKEAPQEEEEPPPDNVISIVPRPGDEDFEITPERIDWRGILDSGTFMSEWMNATCKDDLPEEYYFWLGMMSIGLAVGNQAALGDNPPVKPNLYICLYGPTGIGKSRATNATLSLLRQALPWDKVTASGTYHIPSPGSAEALIDAFAQKTDGGEDAELIPVNGLIRFDELSTLMGRAERSGSAMKPTLMEFYDSYNPVTHKTRGHGEVTAKNHFASAITTTQPRAIRDLLTQTDADSGFVNRWIFAHGTRKKPVAFGREELVLDASVRELVNINEWAEGLSIAGAPRKENEYGMHWTPLVLQEDALDLWSEFFHGVITQTKDEDRGNLLSRTDLAMKKIMTLIGLNRHHVEITLEDVEDTIELWEYLKRSYNLLSQEIGVGVFEDCRLEVIKYVKSHKKRTGLSPTALDILRGMRSRFSSSLLRSVLETMVDFGELEENQTLGKNGKPTKPRYAYKEDDSK